VRTLFLISSTTRSKELCGVPDPVAHRRPGDLDAVTGDDVLQAVQARGNDRGGDQADGEKLTVSR
jgi:hypothetical protein